MKKTAILVCGLALLVACNNAPKPSAQTTEKSPLETLMDSVMHGHDEGMGRIGRVEKASQELSHRIDSIKQSKKIDKALLSAWENAKKNLDVADSSMNKWMNSFDMDMEGMDSIAKVKYLQSNNLWVNGIADSLKAALSNADSLLLRK